MVFEKLILPQIDHNIPTKYNSVNLTVNSLYEMTNTIWVHHIKLLKMFFEPTLEIQKPYCKVTELKKSIETEKSSEIKDAKPEEKKDDNPEAKKLQEEKAKKDAISDTIIRDLESTQVIYKFFIQNFFKTLEKVFNKSGGTVASQIETPVKPGQKAPAKKNATPELEKVILEMASMGYEPEFVDYCARKVSFINIPNILDYILQNPQEIDNFEALKSKKQSELTAEAPEITINKIQPISFDDFNNFVLKETQELDYKLIQNIFQFPDYEKQIVKFIRKSIEHHNKHEKTKSYSQNLSSMVLKLLKHTINDYFKTKYISSFKLPVGVDKEFGKEIIKSYSCENPTTLKKLRTLEISLIYFMKLKRFIPNIDSKIVRSDFLLETMTFFDKLLTSSDEIKLIKDEKNTQAATSFRHITQHFLKLFNVIATARLKPTKPKEGESKPQDTSISS